VADGGLAGLGRPLRRAAAVLRQVLAGATGSDAYARYVEHLRVAHPGIAPPTPAEFAREQMHERWEGVRRCC